MIAAVWLRNFKCFEDQRLAFSNLTLLSGLNGMGKSTVIQALLLLRQSHQQDLLRKFGLALNGDLLRLGTAEDALFDAATEEVISFAIDFSDGAKGAWSFKYDRGADVLRRTKPKISEKVYSQSVFGTDFRYLEAERVGPKPAFEISDFHVKRQKQIGTRGEYAAHYLYVFGREDIPNKELVHPESKSLKLQDQVEAWLSEISPRMRVHLTQHAAMDLVSLQYSYGQLSNQYRAKNVGFGITYTLPILVGVLSVPRGGILLIENPEAHIHPRAQSKIGHLLATAARGGVQVVIETHSDHVLNGIRVAVRNGHISPEEVQLHYFERSTEDGSSRVQVSSPKIDKNGRIDKWPGGFFDEWEKALESLVATES